MLFAKLKALTQRQGGDHDTHVKSFERKKQKFSQRHLNKNSWSGFCSKVGVLLGKMRERE